MSDNRFRRLGDTLTVAWSRRNFDELAFPELATAALAAADLHGDFSPSGMLADLVLRDPGTPQPDGTFGEPPIVPYRGRGFYIELLTWLDATTDIHSHAFSGAFQVLHGASIHSRWGFTETTRVRSTLRFGAVDFHAVEPLARGDIRPILAGPGFMHALFHLARPSVSVVVRTTRESDHLPQLNYLPPHVAWDPHEDDRLRDRRAQALTALLETDRPALYETLESLARDSDLATLFHALRHLAKHLVPAAELTHFASLARARHGELADRMLASLLEHLRQRHIIARRAHVTDPQLRWLMALLLNVPTRRDILRLVREAGHVDPLATVLGGLRALARKHGPRTTTLLDLEFAHPEGGSERVITVLISVIAALMSDAAPEQVINAAAQSVGGLSAAEGNGVPSLIRDLKAPASPLLPLFR